MGLDTHRRNVSERKRASILEAARNSFLENGYSRAGMAEIARDADVSTATLYKHFSSKEELFSAVVKHAGRSVANYTGLVAPDDTARDILYKLCKAYISVQYDHNVNALMRIVIAEVPSAPKLAAEMYEVIGNRRNEGLMAVIDAMIERGMLRPHDSSFGVRIGAGMLKEFFVWPALFDANFQIPEDAEDKIEACIDAYLKLYGPTAS
ncbi:MAG: TetR/AcrR family transcriptional regulator [Parvibaculum sp.]|uniref:TetR/AcrR family transcriptional regulator n=1 Tax=Parvibaculum sp. TaxID=2024848 RepID=UPI001DF5492F|nr:TetR/AcrR family transcriptional regulator [Parvibaculum sp.]MBX3488755.1 TetR/AcrR family transcriptional regulator [Parvibaculum sp.]MBX3496365.1 TetR/AcrR family transcriptional regulator [Parvibaculum sp.]MCW5727363.1 TetR/AcrR family transcriptional regulator [Parvibaculum sp.]